MEMYLSKKKKYIEEKEMTDYQIYWIDIPLLGCLTYAISKGFKITVETEYAPRWVYEITNI
jgi:hypothetical protein